MKRIQSSPVYTTIIAYTFGMSKTLKGWVYVTDCQVQQFWLFSLKYRNLYLLRFSVKIHLCDFELSFSCFEGSIGVICLLVTIYLNVVVLVIHLFTCLVTCLQCFTKLRSNIVTKDVIFNLLKILLCILQFKCLILCLST